MRTSRRISAFWVLLFIFSGWLPAAWSAPAAVATASLVAGEVQVIASDGLGRRLQKDAEVYSGERVVTGTAAYVRLAFTDGSAVILRPETTFAVENFVYATNAQPTAASSPLIVSEQSSAGNSGNRAVLRLLRGGFRAVSGLIGKIHREQYRVLTPVATIGIRGTKFLGVICDAVCVADPVIQAAMRAAPDQLALGGLVTGVDEGGITISSLAGGPADVDAAQFLLTTPSGRHLRLTGVPGFLRGETWLTEDKAATAPTGGGSPLPPVSTAVAAGAGAALIGVIAGLALDSDGDANDGSSSTATSTSTSTSTTTLP